MILADILLKSRFFYSVVDAAPHGEAWRAYYGA